MGNVLRALGRLHTRGSEYCILRGDAKMVSTLKTFGYTACAAGLTVRPILPNDDEVRKWLAAFFDAQPFRERRTGKTFTIPQTGVRQHIVKHILEPFSSLNAEGRREHLQSLASGNIFLATQSQLPTEERAARPS